MKANVNGRWEFDLNAISENTGSGQPDFVKTSAEVFHLILAQKGFTAVVKSINREEKTVSLSVNGKDFEVQLQTPQDLLLQKLGINASAGKKINQLKAPMPGLLLSILVKEGEAVAKGDALCLLEAMKMENVLKAPADLVIKKISVSEKQAVEKGQILMEFN